MTIWTKEEVREALLPLIKENHLESVSKPITGISMDSRSLDKGDLFFAIKGDVTDGHGYVKDALDRGASLVVVDQTHEAALKPVLAGQPHLVVVDTLKAMELLGNEARQRTAATVIGITGSVGKTSVRHVLGFLLSKQGKTVTSQKSYNNHWGVPLSLSHLDQDADYGVFEMGMNAPGEIRRLTLQVRPHVALITTIGQAHMGRLGSVEAIATAKAEIFAGLDQRKGIAVLNADAPCFELLVRKAQEANVSKVYTFSLHSQADVTLVSHEDKGECQHIVVNVLGQDYEVNLPLRGSHWIPNILGVFATLHAAGADLVKAATDMAHLTAVDGRGVVHQVPLSGGGHITLIDDSYNANPTSMAAGIALLATFPGRRIAVLGDMLELGDSGQELHEALAAHLVEAEVDTLYTCGPLMGHLHEVAPAAMKGAWKSDSIQLAQVLLGSVRSGDVILIKGSNSIKMSRVLEAIKSLGRSEGIKAC
jgi:UDP-N-acetylmuramoyl-tripeptide--D-alanyl-D-alanine ligase